MASFNKINIEISNICNFQCSFCPPVLRNKKMMDINLFEKIIKEVKPLTQMVTFHLMGEPLAHPQFEEFVEICKKHAVQIFLVSNGYLLKEKHFDLLADPIFYQVNFSLHSFFDNYPEKSAEPYLNKIFSFTELAMTKNPQLYINYRLWNLEEVKGQDSKNKEMLFAIEKHFNTHLSDSFDVKRKKSYRIKNKLYLHYDTEFIWPSLDLPILGEKGTCYGLSSHFGIHADGTVVPCCLDKEAVIVLGHAGLESIESILNNEKSRRILEGFKHNKLHEDLCKRCQYITRFA